MVRLHEASPSTWLTSFLPYSPVETAGHEEEDAPSASETHPIGITDGYLLQRGSDGEKMQRPLEQQQASDLSSGLLSLSFHKNVGESG